MVTVVGKKKIFLLWIVNSIYTLCVSDSLQLLILYMAICSVSQLCLTLCNFMDCYPPGSSVHRISQARILQWVVTSFSKGSSQTRDWTHYLLRRQADSLPLSHLGSCYMCSNTSTGFCSTNFKWYFELSPRGVKSGYDHRRLKEFQRLNV